MSDIKKESSVYLRRIVDDYSGTGNTGPVKNTNSMKNRDVFVEWPKLELEKRGEGVFPLDHIKIGRSLNMITTRVDCADFVLPVFLTMLYRYGVSALLTPEYRKAYKDAVLGYKYAMDDPNEDKNGVCYFTENHQALFASCEYIAGQLFPDEVFSNNGQKGVWHCERGKRRMLQWIDWRAKFGYSEWLSGTYYGEDLLALALVWGLANDEELKKKAGMLIELTLFDIAVNSFDGLLAASSGRAYVQPTLRPELSSTAAVAKMYWGEGSYEAVSLGGIALAVFGYECGEAVKNAALDKGVVINRERMSVDVEDSKKYGLDPAKYDDIMFYWGQQTFLHREVIENSMKLCPSWISMRVAIEAHWEKYGLLEKAGFRSGRFGSATVNPNAIETLLTNSLVADKSYDPDMACCALTQADIYTYKTARYSLSNVQDFRKGKVGYQQHTWQAFMGGRAVVFTNCQGSIEYVDRPNLLAGNRFMPRSVQHENVLLCVYRTPTESAHFFNTHLYFPQREFDEVREEGGWIFGKRGGAYIAVYSSVRGKWRNPDPELYKVLYEEKWEQEFKTAKPWEYNVAKHAVVYICEMGDEKRCGSFDNFVAGFKAASFSGDTFSFTFNSPSQGELAWGWNGPLRANGNEVVTWNYKRYDNPYCAVPFGETAYRISAGGKNTALDFS